MKKYNYLCNQGLSPLKLWVRIPLMARCTRCANVSQWLAAGRLVSPVSSTNKTDPHDITEILLKHHNPNRNNDTTLYNNTHNPNRNNDTTLYNNTLNPNRNNDTTLYNNTHCTQDCLMSLNLCQDYNLFVHPILGDLFVLLLNLIIKSLCNRLNQHSLNSV